LELACDEATNVLANRHSEAFAGVLSSRIRALAISVTVPGSEVSPPIDLPDLHDRFAGASLHGAITTDVRAAALLLADLLRVRSVEALRKDHCRLGFASVHWLDPLRTTAPRSIGQPRALLISPLGTLVHATPVNDQSVKLWTRWNGSAPVQYAALEAALPNIAEQVRDHAVATAAELVRRYDLGDKLVTIRSEVIAQYRHGAPYVLRE
jgi:hypothetical protein